MARIDLTVPSLGNNLVDLRDSMPGDSFNWSWVRPLNQVKYLAIHHTAGPDSQTPTQIANFHISSNGWGGIGYHFLISKEGQVYYVGDISTARANVANLNEQVIGICLIGNFTEGRTPTNTQIDSLNKLCDFFINSPDLPNVNSWDDMLGHKELPGQLTICPGDDWSNWKNLVRSPLTVVQPTADLDRREKITTLYRVILGREPDIGGLNTYNSSPLSVDEIMRAMIESQEHQNLLNMVREVPTLKVQVDTLQEKINSLNSQIEGIERTRVQPAPVIVQPPPPPPPQPEPKPQPKDNSVTLVDAVFSLFKLFFPAREGLR